MTAFSTNRRFICNLFVFEQSAELNMADATTSVPWLLTLMLAGICWKQQQTIHTYEQEASPNIQNPFHVPSDDQTKDSTTVGETKTVDGSSDVFPVEKSHIQERPAIVQPSAEKALTNDEIEDMIEHRALERFRGDRR